MMTAPSLLNQERQVMHPITLAYSARIDDMREVIFAVGKDEIGVRHSVIAV